jgi:hypothetical protein
MFFIVKNHWEPSFTDNPRISSNLPWEILGSWQQRYGHLEPEVRNNIFFKNAFLVERISFLFYIQLSTMIYCPSAYFISNVSSIEILERFQSKVLRMIVDAPWYVPNTVIRRDLQIPTVKEEMRRYSSQYSARLSAHPNDLIVNLIVLPDNRRLRRHLPNDLPTRFLV